MSTAKKKSANAGIIPNGKMGSDDSPKEHGLHIGQHPEDPRDLLLRRLIIEQATRHSLGDAELAAARAVFGDEFLTTPD